MKKKTVILGLVLVLMLSGCGVGASWAGSDTAKGNAKIQEDFEQVPGESNLYYAKTTHVVYWIGGSYTLNAVGDDYTTSYMTVWYAANGKPYVYNTETGELETIE